MVDTDSCISNLDLHTTKNNEPLEIKMKSGWAKNKKFTFNRDMVKRLYEASPETFQSSIKQ